MNLEINVALHVGGKAWGWNPHLAKSLTASKTQKRWVIAENWDQEPQKKDSDVAV
jgi:hypothetical protein